MIKKSVIWILLIFLFACSENAVDSADFKKSDKNQKHEITFIELGSEGCLPCRMMQPVMERLEKDFTGKVRVVFYDVWTKEGKPYAAQYGIRAIPTQVFLDREGNEFYRHLGYFPYEEIVGLLKKHSVKPVK